MKTEDLKKWAAKIPLDTERVKAIYKKLFQDPYEKQLLELQELEQAHPSDMRIKQRIAQTLYKRGEVTSAVEKYKEVCSFFEDKEFLLKAIQTCQHILKIKPNLVDFNLRLANLYQKLDLVNEAANQLRIAINTYAGKKNSEKALTLAQYLVKIDPSAENRAKLAEIYQSQDMPQEALKQLELLASHYRKQKNFDLLLHYYELMLPHKPQDKNLIRDICILNLRKQNPHRALKILEHNQLMDDEELKDLVGKAQVMIEMLSKKKAG